MCIMNHYIDFNDMLMMTLIVRLLLQGSQLLALWPTNNQSTDPFSTNESNLHCVDSIIIQVLLHTHTHTHIHTHTHTYNRIVYNL